MRKPKAIPNWKKLALRFWSVRLAVLAATLSAAEVMLQVWQPDWVAPGTLAAIAGVVSLAAGIARLVAQPGAYRD